MNNNVISNKEVKVASGMNLNDKDYLNCLLSLLKHMARDYTIAMEEASCSKLFNIYKENFLEIITLAREAYDVAFRNGWYQLENADVQKISNKYNTLKNDYQDLNI